MEVNYPNCLRINRPAWFANEAFRRWLRDFPGLLTTYVRGNPVDECASVFLFYGDDECAEVYLDEPPSDVPDIPLFPRKIWKELHAICKRAGFEVGLLWLSNWPDDEEQPFRGPVEEQAG